MVEVGINETTHELIIRNFSTRVVLVVEALHTRCIVVNYLSLLLSKEEEMVDWVPLVPSPRKISLLRNLR